MSSTKLTEDVRYLGLPDPPNETFIKSASKLSVHDMAALGWRIPVGDAETLWNRLRSAAIAFLEECKVVSPYRNIVSQIMDNRTHFMLTGQLGAVPMRVSQFYKLENNILNLTNEFDQQQSDTHLLKVCLHYVAAEDESVISSERLLSWVKRDTDKSAPSGPPSTIVDDSDSALKAKLTPSLMIVENTAEEVDETRRLKEASLISLLRLTGIRTGVVRGNHPPAPTVSELTVEQMVGSALSGIFYNAAKVRVLSGQKHDTPQILRPTKSFPFPDIAAVREGGTPADPAKFPLEPVVIIGEGKVRRRGIRPDPKADAKSPLTADGTAPTALAQMAAAVHPTLILLVLAHYHHKDRMADLRKLYNTSAATAGDTVSIFPDFDQQSMVYGVYYDEESVRIYTHFPQVERSKTEDKFVFRFYQLEVMSFPLLGTTFLERWRMAVALFHVQKHADLISDRLTTVINAYPLSQ